jgi:phage tail tape-measure protein
MISAMSAQTIMEDAMTSGKNLMINFGNGIAEGMSVPLENVRNMVNQINTMLSQMSMPAYGLGWAGVTGGNIYMYNNQRNIASAISSTIGAGVATKILKK